MVASSNSPLASTGRQQLFGRSAELARLIDVADLAVEQGAQAALVSGEAGIGKTTLTSEALAQLAENGWATHVGYCIEYAHRSLPFGAVVSILRSVLTDDGANLDAIIGRRRNDLAALLPELARDKTGPTSLVGDVDRLFDAITVCLQEASRLRPLAVLIEDIHWADAATLDLTASMVRNLGSARVLLVLTERSGSVARSHPLRTWLAEHRRMRNVHYVALEGLTRDELAEQAQSVLNQAPEPALVDELAERTGGNPYFSEELLAARRDGAEALPSSLVDFLTSRLDRLGDDEKQVLRSLAVVGGSASHRMLSDMLPDLPVDHLARSLFDASILVVDGGDYAFAHALLREAIVRDLLPFERTELHRSAAEAIASDPRRTGSLEDLSSLAAHWAAANDPARGIAAAVAAAHASAAVAAYESAAEMAEQALQAWPDAGAPEELTGYSRDQLLLQAADWLTACYRRQEVVQRIRYALATWASGLPNGRRALLLAAMAPNHFALGDPDEARRVLDEAERLVTDEVSPEAAQVHNRVSRQAVSDGQIGPAQVSAERAIAIATVEGPPVVLVEALTTKALALGVSGDLDAALALIGRARDLALEVGLVSQVANTYRTAMLIIVFQQGRTEASFDACRQGLAYAEQHCGPRWRASFRHDLCHGYVEAGRLADAKPLFNPLVSGELDPLRRLYVLQTAGHYALATNSFDLAHAFLDDATDIAARYSSAQETGTQSRLLAELARHEGRLDDAVDLIQEALRYQLAGDNLTFTRESILEQIRIGRACLDHSPDEGERLVDDARRLARGFDDSGTANASIRALMELELASIDGTMDLEVGRATADALEAAGYLLDATEARMLVLTQQASGARSDREHFKAEVSALARTATRHGMSGLLARLAVLARGAGIAVSDSSDASERVAQTASPYPHFLTAREVEVMSLVAEGLTNKGIGERLFVSPRTVSTHISNLLAKLGVANRGEAAAAYHRLGLADLVDDDTGGA